jgi:hypothetical protein
MVVNQHLHSFGRDGVDHTIIPLAELLDEMTNQQGDIFSSFAQRRYSNWKHIEPVVQIGPEFLLIDRPFQIAIRGRDEASIGSQGARAAQTLEFPDSTYDAFVRRYAATPSTFLSSQASASLLGADPN